MQRTSRIALGTALLFCGCMIYLIWRSADIILVKWTYSLGLGTVVDMLRSGIGCHYPGDFAVYTLPDALYCLAYVLIMDSVWQNGRPLPRIFMSLLLPVIVIIHELLQLTGQLHGTFDIADLACYIAIVLAYIAYLFLPTHYKPKILTR